MTDLKKKTLIQLRNKLIQKGLDNQSCLSIVMPLKTVEQINQMLQWLQNNPQAKKDKILRQSLVIAKA